MNRKPRSDGEVVHTRSCVAARNVTSNSLSRISMSGIPGLLGCQKYKLGPAAHPSAGGAAPRVGSLTHAIRQRTTRSMRFMSEPDNHSGIEAWRTAPHWPSCPSMSSTLRHHVLAAFTGRALMIFRAGLAFEYCWLLCERI